MAEPDASWEEVVPGSLPMGLAAVPLSSPLVLPSLHPHLLNGFAEVRRREISQERDR